MKRNFILLFALLLSSICFSQYIAVKAKYTETRLVDDAPNPPKRENRLVLTFYNVTETGVHTPANLTDYDIWVYDYGLQFAGGGPLDSTGNNYPGYSYTAPRVISYNNTRGLNFIDCDPNIARHYVVNGNTLDCGFITVSYWTYDWGTMIPFEAFHAPYVCLPYLPVGHPMYYTPGNLNFGWNQEYPWCCVQTYNWFCGSGTLELITRGAMPADTGNFNEPLPVRFANVRGELIAGDIAKISWSNLTETGVDYYEVQKATDNINFIRLDTVLPKSNNTDRVDYDYLKWQPEAAAIYRIKAVERDGSILYSPVISLRLPDSNITVSNQTVLRVYPNPVTGGALTFQLSNAPKGRYVMSVVTPDGRQVKQKMIEHDGNGDLLRQISCDGLPPGLYRLVLGSAAYKYSASFLFSF